MSVVQVSWVKRASDTDTRDIGVAEVIEAIRTGRKLRGPIEQIRNRFEAELAISGDYVAAKRATGDLKNALPGVAWSGKFSQRANDKLIEHSGLLCADLDSLGSELQRIREQLLASPHLWALFKSPSGDGLKAVFRVPADGSKHGGSFRAIERHVRAFTGVQIDQKCKDVARLCYLSLDPDIYLNEGAQEIRPLPEPEKPKAHFTANSEVNLSERQRITVELFGAIDWESDTSGFCACPGIEKHTNPNGRRDCRVSLDNSPAPTIHCVHNSCNAIIETYNYRLRSLIGKAEFVPTPGVEAERGNHEPVEPPPAPASYVLPPLDLLPGELRDYVHAAAESLNVDVSFILLPLLSALGSAIGNARSILLKRNFIQPPIMWTGIVGRSGSRKSPALEAATFAVMEHERELTQQNKVEAERHENDLVEWEAKSKKDRGTKLEPPPALTCLMDDVTLEALADAIQENPRGVLVKRDELSHWFAAFDQYHSGKGADVSRWLSLHTGVLFGLDRRTDKRRYRIHHPRVCIAGGIQPKVLARVLTEDFFERGLPARFLFAHPPMRQDKWSEAEVSDVLRGCVSELFGELWSLQPEGGDHGQQCPKLLRLDKDGQAEYIRYYNECGASAVQADEREEAAWCKLSGYAARLALVGQLARHPHTEIVTGETMRAACDLARWCGNEAGRIYASLSETREQRELRKLVEFIESRGGAATARDVMQSYWPLKNKREETEKAFAQLVKEERAKWEEIRPPGPGRPTRQIRLLRSSTSTKFDASPRKAGNCVDVDAREYQKNEPSDEPGSGDANQPEEVLI